MSCENCGDKCAKWCLANREYEAKVRADFAKLRAEHDAEMSARIFAASST